MLGRVLPEKLTGSQLVKKFPAFHGTRRLIAAFTSARHLSLSCASSIQSTPPQPSSWRPTLIVCSPSTPRSSKCSLSVKAPHQNPVYLSPESHICHVSSPSHSSWFQLPDKIWWAVQNTKQLSVHSFHYLLPCPSEWPELYVMVGSVPRSKHSRGYENQSVNLYGNNRCLF